MTNCLRTKICNFSMDWDWDTEPLAAIVKAVEVKRDGKESYADFEIVDYENIRSTERMCASPTSNRGTPQPVKSASRE